MMSTAKTIPRASSLMDIDKNHIGIYLLDTPIPNYLFKLIIEYVYVKWYTDENKSSIFQLCDDEYEFIKYHYEINRIFKFKIAPILYPIVERICIPEPCLCIVDNALVYNYISFKYNISDDYIINLKKSLFRERIINIKNRIEKINQRHVGFVKRYIKCPFKKIKCNQNSIFSHYNING